MTLRARALVRVVLFAGPLAAAPAAPVDKITLESRAYEDTRNGYQVKTPRDWVAVPVPPEKAELGLLLYIESEKPEGRRMYVFRMDAVEGKGGSTVRPDVTERLEMRPFGIDGFEKRELVEDEQVKLKELEAQHRTWETRGLTVDSWTFRAEGYDLSLVYTVASDLKFKNRWLSLYEKSAKTFEIIERDSSGESGPGASYEDLLVWHEADAARTPGWRALPTPSEKFIIVTSSDADKFIDEVVDRLEKSRDVFEEDFPPPDDFDDVSVVRICDSEQEFHKYGGTSSGVAGWFNPISTELVLYDAQATNRNESYAVMTHEAFHQYCHFLFGKSEAHRWFDEGHGDYYGGIRFKGSRAKVTARMPGGLDRFIRAKELIRTEQFLAIEDHLNATHREWQSQGPSNTSPYEQSWSIVYMLRQGAEGKVTKKVWKKEYADIVPNYVSTLKAGFAEAYDELRAKAGDAAGEMEFDRTHISPERKEKIWEAAMEASWGDIDLDEFEENWKLYVTKYLKD